MRKISKSCLFLLILVMLSVIPANAATNYTINGVTVRYSDFSSSPNECWDYARRVYSKIWGASSAFSSEFASADNMLRNCSDSQLLLNVDNLKKYVSAASLGSCLRICNASYLHGTDGWGHSQIIVQKDSDGFTVIEGGLSAYPHCREKYYTWNEYCTTGWLGGTYAYIKYIKWPSSFAYSGGHNPQGYIDVAVSNSTGKITVSGWAFDKDDPSKSIDVHVYIGGSSGSTNAVKHVICANKSGNDVNTAFGISGNHRFSETLDVSLSGNQSVYFYGINIGGGNNVEIGHRTINIMEDKEPPVISNIVISDYVRGYKIECIVSDNVGVTNVIFPTWTKRIVDGTAKDDLVQHKGIIDGNKAICKIYPSDHNDEYGDYITDIEVYDAAGNKATERVTKYVNDSATWEDSPEPAGTWYLDYHKYELYDLSMSWKEAKAFCESKGGHLITITSEEENEFVNFGHKDYYYIGATDENKEGIWNWITDEAFEYSNWNAQDDHSSGMGEDFAVIQRTEDDYGYGRRTWSDVIDKDDNLNGSNFFRYTNIGLICEYEPEYDISKYEVIPVPERRTYQGFNVWNGPDGAVVRLGDVELDYGCYNYKGENCSRAGIGKLTVTGKAPFYGSKTVDFLIDKAPTKITATPEKESISEGEEITVSTTCEPLNSHGTGYSFKWYSDDESIATVKYDSFHNIVSIKGISKGTTSIRAVYEETTSYLSSETSFLISVTEAHQLVTIPGKEPTCIEPGLTEGKRCSICGELIKGQEEISPLGHTQETIPSIAPTCEESGYSEGKKCSVCNTIIQEPKELPPKGHKEKNINHKDPTCTENGCTDGTICEICGKVIKSATVIPANGHTIEIIQGYKSTCTEKGLTDGKRCSVCGEILEKQVTIEATGHQFGEWETLYLGNCEGAGSEKRICKVCGLIETKNLNLEGHTWSEVFTIDKKPTCTESGSKSIHCLNCNAVKDSTVIPALKHDFGAWIIVEDETCTKSGNKEKRCKTCGAVVSEIIPAGHQWENVFTIDKPATCTESGIKSIHCSNCTAIKDQQEIKAVGHVTVTLLGKKATTTTTGLTEGKKCSVCEAIIVPQTVIPKVTIKPTVKSTLKPMPKPTATPIPKPQIASDGTAVGAGASQSVAEVSILATTSDEGPEGTKFNLLQAQMSKAAKKSITIKWRSVPGAKYIVYGAPCGKKMAKLADVNSTRYIQTGLKKGTYYKYLVLAVKDGKVVSTSKTLHIATSGGKVGNNTKVKLSKKNLTLKKGKSKKLKATVKKGKLKVKKHRSVKWESSDPTVATVSGSGKVKALKAGKATIYAYAQNGKYAKCTVKVK